MTFVLHPLSHYNSITEPCARFLLSLLEHLTIDFPFHFIFSIIDVHRDSASRDKLIFPFAITRILRHFSIPFPSSNHFSVMCAIDYATVKCSEAQFQSRQSDSATPSSCSAPSHSTRLDTLSTELYQVNIRVGRIAWRQASIDGYASEASPPPPPPVASDFEDEDDNDGDDHDASDDDDGDVSSTDEILLDTLTLCHS